MKTKKLDKLTKTTNMMVRYNYRLHHIAIVPGYCNPSDPGNKCRYQGIFGKGWIVTLGKYRGSNNYTEIAYYVK